ncbi:solute carrier organic anion transporter family member 5A1 [Agrilus planipennis]|uniref:Solute carrier organic anion transporter family member n=1 Tax=Agrilus planipennis TaxID=224129 RepID=A0A1W4X2G3_AGRPL|nr:solute carrier organic anion transporter family member 5A1 [Agrilus planipennis]XP_018326967.1 solute carrier organic anion transporter family member 5A1 [Agrilus planipennis]XP_018326968.1 solute carrier organic anion transporter family member 5A1 [Agrilus planipennis]
MSSNCVTRQGDLLRNEKQETEIEPMLTIRKLTDDETLCGFWIFKGRFLQKFANKKAFIILYGILGCLYGSTFAYFNGTITTLEKRFKITSRTTGIITVGNDLSQLLVAAVLSYYAGRRHKPRWMALGMYSVVLFCLLSASPHFFFGPGEDALLLTKEYGPILKSNLTNSIDTSSKRSICKTSNVTTECAMKKGSSTPQIIFFIGQFISGVGSLYYSLGVSYMDDNIKKSKTPAVISISFFLKMLGPMIGYTLASFCLRIYISPTLTPTITYQDQRWLGAWWLGWIILALPIFALSSVLALFPKSLPRAAARRLTRQMSSKASKNTLEDDAEIPTSFKDMLKTFKRLLANPTLMLNNFAAVFYFLGYMPYWIFLPKYIESIYHQSASASSLITGTVSLVFSAIGVLLSGVIISKCKPRARYLAAWNVIVGAVSVIGMISYAFLGCMEIKNKNPLTPSGELNPKFPCNQKCHCDYVKYNPVCSEDGKTTFISACHAGCTGKQKFNGSFVYSNCACISPVSSNVSLALPNNLLETKEETHGQGGKAFQGNCPIDCVNKFYVFLVVVCILKFSGATGRASNFLVTVRCVEERDKPVAMGFGVMVTSLCAFIPSPILFGYILDKACLVWGKTCTGTGNCWLYNGEILRYRMNFTAASFVTIGTIFDLGVWYFVKDLKIFDEEVELELKDINEEPR